MGKGGEKPTKKTANLAVAAFEGTLLKDPDPFPYFMLVAFEASGLLRFVILLLLYPLVALLRASRRRELALRVMAFAAVAGVREAKIAAVARAVLPKFFSEDLNFPAWELFSSRRRRAIVTSMPTIMVGFFAKEHLGAEEISGPEVIFTRFGIATGFLKQKEDYSPPAALERPLHSDERAVTAAPPRPVVFHDGRLVRRPTPAAALLVTLWLPLGILLAITRLAVLLVVPFRWIRATAWLLGGELIVRGRPPPQVTSKTSGVLLVCNHRTVMDGITISATLSRKIPSVTYSISRLTEILSPVKLLRLTRERETDAKQIKTELAKSDLLICPEGTTCREPFLLRFSMLFAELTDRIVPLAVDCRPGIFHATTARGWKAMDPIFFLMNPRPSYEITFLDQLPLEETCAGGKRPQEVANYVQRIIADALGFQCCYYSRKDKYMLLAGHEGVNSSS